MLKNNVYGKNFNRKKISIAVIVQCRLSSTRFPRKALKPLGDRPVLAWTLNSMHKINADRYFVATDEASFGELKPVCEKYGFECFAGSLENVLERFCNLIEEINADVIVRATADNPYLFYEAAQESLNLFLQKKDEKHPCDYLTFTGLPHGCGVEIIDAKSLLKATSLTDLPYDKEHVGPALYNHQDNFKCDFIPSPKRFYNPSLRATIDTYSDYLRALMVCQYVKFRRIENNSENNSKKSPEELLCSESQFFAEPFTTEEILGALNQTSVKKPLVLCPSVKKGCGTGHLHRCLAVASDTKSFVYVPEDATLSQIDETIKMYEKKGLENWQIISVLPDETYAPVIVTDEFCLSKQKLDLYKKNSSIISIDEGSDFTDSCDYLLDIIPSYKLTRNANLTDSSFIQMPKNVRSKKMPPDEFQNILICMGGEDPSGFTKETALAFSRYFHNGKVTAIVSEKNLAEMNFDENPGSDEFVFKNDLESAYSEKNKIDAVQEKILRQKNKTSFSVKFVKTVPDLREKLFEYDLVVTHYGLTAFEALYAGCAVILLPTTKLHEQLAEKYGFACLPSQKKCSGKNSANICDISASAISRALNSDKLYADSFFTEYCCKNNHLKNCIENDDCHQDDKKSVTETIFMPSKKMSPLSAFLEKTAEGQKLTCPVCREIHENDMVISRNATRTYRRCSECSLIYISWTMDEKKEYRKSYFFEEYKKQYGKTYEEDFESIKAQGKRRLSVIKGMVHNRMESMEGKTLLDIGCAYGPFLSAAKDFDLNPFGTDISSDAVNFVQNKLNFPASVAAFPDLDVETEFGKKDFDIITMWYVIEHFKDLDCVLKKVSEILKRKGIFAFSTPSAQGISAKSDWNEFFKKSPTDHYSVWEPSQANKILNRYGLKVEKIVSTGHHPERFPCIKKSGAKKDSLQWKMIDRISRIKKLGDTVEIYCRHI